MELSDELCCLLFVELSFISSYGWILTPFNRSCVSFGKVEGAAVYLQQTAITLPVPRTRRGARVFGRSHVPVVWAKAWNRSVQLYGIQHHPPVLSSSKT